MKKTILIIATIISTVAFSQQPISKTIGEFSTVKVYDLIEVNMVKSDNNSVEITGKKTEDVVVVNNNGKLKIKMKIDEIFDGKETKVTLYYTNIDVADANEGAKIIFKDTVKQFEIQLNAQEGGYIKADIDVAYAEIKSVTGGKIKTSGKAKNQDIDISTGGIYEGEKLTTKNIEVSVNAGGEAYVHAKKSIDIRIKAGGDVYVYGEPEEVYKSKVLGGRIKMMQ